MRRLILFLVIAVLTATPVWGQTTHIGLYPTQDYVFTGYCPAPPYHMLEMWICVMPGANGQICAEFKIEYPANVAPTNIFKNEEIISVELGDFSNGISVCYKTCQYEWHWIYHQTVFVFDSNPGQIRIVPHPEGSGQIQIASCEQDYPIETAYVMYDLYYNEDCPPEP